MSRERLQKILARAGIASRRQVEEMIVQGRVTVNGRVAELGQKADLEQDSVRVDGKRVKPARQHPVYLLVNKPAGVVSTRSDPEGRTTVLDLIPERFHRGLVTVGRLDYDSEGLLLLTDDGEFAQKVAHPRHGCSKTYEAKVKGAPSEAGIERLRGGIVLDGRRTAPARIHPQGHSRGARDASANSWWQVVLTEGRTRQIREMFHRIGHPVQRLRRVAIGSLRDPRLPRGGWRELSPRDLELIAGSTSTGPTQGRPARGRSVPIRGASSSSPHGSRTTGGRATVERKGKARRTGGLGKGPRAGESRGREGPEQTARTADGRRPPPSPGKARGGKGKRLPTSTPDTPRGRGQERDTGRGRRPGNGPSRGRGRNRTTRGKGPGRR
ncbi:MAG: pseudouridine synthase [Holophagales bacterium]|nr:pseudouridine synthase [Holophagales bacterium]